MDMKVQVAVAAGSALVGLVLLVTLVFVAVHYRNSKIETKRKGPAANNVRGRSTGTRPSTHGHRKANLPTRQAQHKLEMCAHTPIPRPNVRPDKSELYQESPSPDYSLRWQQTSSLYYRSSEAPNYSLGGIQSRTNAVTADLNGNDRDKLSSNGFMRNGVDSRGNDQQIRSGHFEMYVEPARYSSSGTDSGNPLQHISSAQNKPSNLYGRTSNYRQRRVSASDEYGYQQSPSDHNKTPNIYNRTSDNDHKRTSDSYGYQQTFTGKSNDSGDYQQKLDVVAKTRIRNPLYINEEMMLLKLAFVTLCIMNVTARNML